jgi:YD repeat-containing protein
MSEADTMTNHTSHGEQQSSTDDEFAPPSVRNVSQVGVGVFSHSGELIMTASDLGLPGRGEVAPMFERRYRSSVTDDGGDFGRGFTWTYSRQLIEGDDGIVYDNGYDEKYVFEPIDDGEYTNNLLYAVLVPGNEQRPEWELRGPGGRIEQFEPPTEGGRLLAIKDRNGNAITFNYTDETVIVTDPWGRETTVVYKEGRIVTIEDCAGRTVTYAYDDANQLQTVTLANDGTKEYDWTDGGRLAAVTAPGKETPFLENDYDDEARVVRQRHGTGEVTISYEQVGTNEPGFPIYRTHIAQKGVAEPNLHLEHNAAGQVTRRVFDEPVETDRTDDGGTIRTMEERDLSAAEIEEGVAHIETRTEYNDRGEWIWRKSPEGDTIKRTFDADAINPRDRGNLLEHRHVPNSDRPTDHDERVISAEYGPFQRRTSMTDARGNTTHFEYDESGNLVRKIHPEVEIPDLRDPGATRTEQYTEEWMYNQFGQPIEYRDQEDNCTRYEYYPVDGPYELDKATFGVENGGPLARVRTERGLAVPPRVLGSGAFDATTEDYTEAYEYDDLERVTRFRDGKGNEATHEYDAHGNPVTSVDRGGVRTEREFDLANNLITEEKPFTRYVDGDADETVEERETRLREFREYNLLNNVVGFGQIAIADNEAGSEVARRETRLYRDVNENVLRRTYPDGVDDIYTYSRRGKRVETRAAAGTGSEGIHQFRFRRDGQERARIDAEDYRLTKEYDGFSRLLSVTNPDGVTKRRVYDSANNLRASYLLTSRETDTTSLDDGVLSDGGQVAMTAQFNDYDSMNRCSGGRTVAVGRSLDVPTLWGPRYRPVPSRLR